MLFRQIVNEDLGCASYLVGDPKAGVAAVIDPQWDIEPYLHLSRIHGVRSLEVDVPAGIDDGQRLRLSGRGPAGPRGGPAGDFYVQVRVAPDAELQRRGDEHRALDASR